MLVLISSASRTMDMNAVLMNVVTHWVFWVFLLSLVLQFYSHISAFINELQNNWGVDGYSIPTSVDVAVYEGLWFLITRTSRTFKGVVLCLVCYGIYAKMHKIEEFFNSLSDTVTAFHGFVEAVLMFARRDRMHVDQPEVADAEQEVADTDAAEDTKIPTRNARSATQIPTRNARAATPLGVNASGKGRSPSRGRGRGGSRGGARVTRASTRVRDQAEL